jgi:putative transferase (TIGR04331 family)
MLLVTTAIEETWGTDEEILFLGEWCKLYDRKEIWQKRIHTTLPYNWDSRDQLYSDAEYLSELFERLLPKLSAKLNEIHGTKHSLRYWRIFVGIWLGFFLQILFQRWASIDIATKSYHQLNTVLLTDRIGRQIPNDMTEFTELMAADRWNHYIFSEIIKFQGIVNYSYVEPIVDSEEMILPTLKIYRYRQSLKGLALNLWNFFLSPFTKDKDLLFINTYLPFFDEIKLNFRFRQAPKYNQSKPLSRVNSNKEMRQWNLDRHALTEFERFINVMLPLNIPSAYLEGYGGLKKQSDSLNWPKSSELIFTSNSHIYDDLVKFWIASKVDHGCSYVVGQHGGGPLHAINFQTEHELYICDRYLAPGCGNSFHPKIAEVGQFFRRRWNHNPGGSGLLIQLSVPRYSYSISSTVQGSDYSKYQDEQQQFFDLLHPNIRENFTVRLHAGSVGWNNTRLMWRDCFPDVTIDNGQKSIYHFFSQSRLIVCTYAGTTYNQAIAANAPTVIFWNPKDSQLHKASNLIFEDLKRVGIFHDTPESAAAHVNAIWDDVDAWWTSAEVQEVVLRFTKLYCNLPDNILDRIETVLRDVIAEADNKSTGVST